jgi:hypothetical protein
MVKVACLYDGPVCVQRPQILSFAPALLCACVRMKYCFAALTSHPHYIIFVFSLLFWFCGVMLLVQQFGHTFQAPSLCVTAPRSQA